MDSKREIVRGGELVDCPGHWKITASAIAGGKCDTKGLFGIRGCPEVISSCDSDAEALTEPRPTNAA